MTRVPVGLLYQALHRARLSTANINTISYISSRNFRWALSSTPPLCLLQHNQSMDNDHFMARGARRRGMPWLKYAPYTLQKPSSHLRNNTRQRQPEEKAMHDASLHEATTPTRRRRSSESSSLRCGEIFWARFKIRVTRKFPKYMLLHGI